ncbi:hypothetical protein DIPPA_23502 [Diplonema papillatum]|nr:hypothetical protein DIPPA_23502 [Diplonema papillatum]|eukprot:gene12002-18537_t
MGQVASASEDGKTWPPELDVYVTPNEKSLAVKRWREMRESGQEKRGLHEFAKWFSIPPPCIVGGLSAPSAVERWRARCLGEDWEPSPNTAPGISKIRWYLPPRSDDWLELYNTANSGTSLASITNVARLYPAAMVLVLRLHIGCVGCVVLKWPAQDGAAWEAKAVPILFYAAGRRLSILTQQRPQQLPVEDPRDARKGLCFGPLRISRDLSRVIVSYENDGYTGERFPDDAEHIVASVELWGAGSSQAHESYKRRLQTRDSLTTKARSINRQHMAGSSDADRFILQAAGVLGDRPDPSANRL